jgi:acyl dehydratase
MGRLRYASVAEVLDAVGDEVGPSRWISLGQPRIDAFADTTEDRQWIHTDPARAAEGPYGGTVAHGFLTLSLLSPVVTEIFTVGDLHSAVNYGLNRVRFPAPALAGRPVRGSATVQQVESTSTGVRVTLQVTMEAEGNDRPVCVADFLMLLVPRQVADRLDGSLPSARPDPQTAPLTRKAL